MFHKALSVATSGLGLYEITEAINGAIKSSGISDGMCNIFITHTSASLCIQENADYTAKRDLEEFMGQLVRYQSWFSHTAEGRDDMTAHIKAALTATSLNIPVINGRLGVGIWQGVYVWEHRERAHQRQVTVSVWS
ncbi:YjbQ family protein [bacterium]|nr:YjbQ family protein [bacterium]